MKRWDFSKTNLHHGIKLINKQFIIILFDVQKVFILLTWEVHCSLCAVTISLIIDSQYSRERAIDLRDKFYCGVLFAHRFNTIG